MDPTTRFCVICNQGSGRTRIKDQQIEAAMAVLGDRASLRLTSGPSIADSAREAVAEGFGTVVAAGGDGTLRSVAEVVVGSRARFGVLPMGTLNHFAQAHDIPLEPEAAARLLLSGQTRRIAVGEVNGRVFLNNMSIGLYPAMLRTREEVERRWGRSRLAAHWAAVRAFVRPQRPLHLGLTVEGETLVVTTPLLFAACSAPQLKTYELRGEECLAVGKLPVLVLPEITRTGLLLESVRLVLSATKPGRDFDLTCAREVTIASRSLHLTVACDGEKLRLDTPLRLRLRADALEVCAPLTPDSSKSLEGGT